MGESNCNYIICNLSIVADMMSHNHCRCIGFFSKNVIVHM